VSGALGNGSFEWYCVDEADPVCPDQRRFPTAVALGATFRVDFDADTVNEATQIESGSTAFLVEQPGTEGEFVAVGEGTASIVVYASGHRLLDLIYVDVVAPDRLAMRSSGVVGGMDPGDYGTVTANAVDATGATLAGSLLYAWHADPDGIVEIVPSGNDDVVEVRARSAGLANVYAAVGDLLVGMSVEVIQPVPPPTTTATGSTGDTGGTTISTRSTGDTGGAP
jgi:hypothetical protein